MNISSGGSLIANPDDRTLSAMNSSSRNGVSKHELHQYRAIEPKPAGWQSTGLRMDRGCRWSAEPGLTMRSGGRWSTEMSWSRARDDCPRTNSAQLEWHHGACVSHAWCTGKGLSGRLPICRATGVGLGTGGGANSAPSQWTALNGPVRKCGRQFKEILAVLDGGGGRVPRTALHPPASRLRLPNQSTQDSRIPAALPLLRGGAPLIFRRAGPVGVRNGNPPTYHVGNNHTQGDAVKHSAGSNAYVECIRCCRASQRTWTPCRGAGRKHWGSIS